MLEIYIFLYFPSFTYSANPNFTKILPIVVKLQGRVKCSKGKSVLNQILVKNPVLYNCS